MIAALAIGDEAWCLFTRTSGKRSHSGPGAVITGAGRVRIESIGVVFECRVLRADGGMGHLIDLVRPFQRRFLFATSGDENRRFGLWLKVMSRTANDAEVAELFGRAA